MNILKIVQKLTQYLSQLVSLSERIEDLQQAVGRVEMRQLQLLANNDIHTNEFKVFSQNGEDGIIQFLVRKIPIEKRVFVEFGIGSYSECNTRFLLKNNNWSGLVIDGSTRYIEKLKQDNLYWKHGITSQCSFITADNINDIITSSGISGDIGILSIDIDGNDYWIWKAIDCIQPRIVICEYNNLFGYERNVTTIYNPNFVDVKAHFSGLYWGASIGAFNHLAKQKGYSLVGSNTTGNNIFFVRNDVIGEVLTFSQEDAYVTAKFRISRDQNGELSFLNAEAGLKLIEDMLLYEVDTNKTIAVKDLSLQHLNS
jgi:hypothetical protein